MDLYRIRFVGFVVGSRLSRSVIDSGFSGMINRVRPRPHPRPPSLRCARFAAFGFGRSALRSVRWLSVSTCPLAMLYMPPWSSALRLEVGFGRLLFVAFGG